LVEDATNLITTINSLPTTTKGVIAAAVLTGVTTLDASAGPFNLQTNMMLAGAIQQMQTDPFLVGSLMFSSSTVISLNPAWRPDSSGISTGYLATYGYGFSAQGPFSNVFLLQSQSKTSSGSPF
jgi:hypothetical protein